MLFRGATLFCILAQRLSSFFTSRHCPATNRIGEPCAHNVERLCNKGRGECLYKDWKHGNRFCKTNPGLEQWTMGVPLGIPTWEIPFGNSNGQFLVLTPLGISKREFPYRGIPIIEFPHMGIRMGVLTRDFRQEIQCGTFHCNSHMGKLPKESRSNAKERRFQKVIWEILFWRFETLWFLSTRF